jgi:hypothetical protein
LYKINYETVTLLLTILTDFRLVIIPEPERCKFVLLKTRIPGSLFPTFIASKTPGLETPLEMPLEAPLVSEKSRIYFKEDWGKVEKKKKRKERKKRWETKETT